MNSDYRFRVWSGEEMHEPPHDYLVRSFGSLWRQTQKYPHQIQPADGEVLLTTGPTDAWGIEVWRHDIGEFHLPQQLDEGISRAIVDWNDDEGQWGLFTPSGESLGSLSSRLDSNEIEIIGNRYEHPHLLKQDK